MKTLFIAFVLLCGCAAAQNLRIDDIALGPKGPIAFASVAFCTQPATTSTQPCSPLASLCSSLSDTTCSQPNPVTTDFLGNYHAYVKGGQTPYTVQIYGASVAAPFVKGDQGALGTPITLTNNPGTFTNTQMNQYFLSLVGGIPNDMYRSVQGFGGFTTEAGTFGVAVPSTAGIKEADGVVGMITSNCNSSGRTTCNSVAVSSHARALANGAAVWGHNGTVDNATGTTGVNIIGDELDIGVRSNQSSGYVHGIDIFLTPQPGATLPSSTSGSGIEIGAALLNAFWFDGLFISGASINSSGGNAIYIDQNCATGAGACNSPPITLVGQDGSNVQHSGSWFTDSNGNLVLTAGATGLGVKPPQSTFASLGSSAANGVVVYCTDCKNIPDDAAVAGAACAGTGHGTVARRDNARWDCN